MIQVHVFPFQHNNHHDFTAQCLCESDQMRLSGIQSESRRKIFLFSRKVLYRVLGEATGMPSSALQIGTGRHGKPRVENAPGFLDFSLSHSSAFLAIAISRDRPVGIDIEDTVMRGPPPQLETVCSKNELQQLALQPNVNFLDVWTKKEAFLKLNGVGLTVSPKAVEPLPGDVMSYKGAEPLIHQRARVKVFNSSPNYVMSVAYPALRGDKASIELIEQHCV